MGGYVGKILRVDLSRQKVLKEKLPKPLIKEYVGCKGFCARILYDENPLGVEPFAPENTLVYATGPLTGTPAFGAKSSFATKSPLTGAWLDSGVGGHLGAELKFAGYDILVIKGKATKPVYLWINDGDAEIKDASDIWGKDCFEATKIIQEKTGAAHVATIGPAGERLVKIANVAVDFHRFAGRGGLGAVMGSKNLKAIAIKGTGAIGIDDSEKFLELLPNLLEMIWKPFDEYGTMMFVDPMNEFGLLPTRNFQRGMFDHVEKVNAEALMKLKVRDRGCFGCIIHGEKITKHKYKGEEFLVRGPEYESTVMLGPNCGIDDISAIAYMTRLCNMFGIDTISTGSIIGFVMECYEKGVLSEQELGDLKPNWGDSESAIELIRMIAYREGVGNTLAEGVNTAAEKIGKNAERYAMHVKGLEIPAYDPRGVWGMALAYATSDRGACHLRAWTIFAEVMGGQVMDRFSIEGKAALVIAMQNSKALEDSLGICEQVGFPVLFIDLLNAATGLSARPILNEEVSTRPILEDIVIDGNGKVGERIYNLTRLFNMREGFKRKDDYLPPRFFEEALPEGKSKGRPISLEEFNKMLDEYYKLRGWDKEGTPTGQKLSELGLKG